MLEELVRKEDLHGQAKQRHLALLESGLCLGTGGRIQWQREDLHER